MSGFRKGTDVRWKWGTGEAEGKVVEVHTEAVTRKLGGATITRHGSTGNPALLIKQADGDEVLKLSSEVSRSY